MGHVVAHQHTGKPQCIEELTDSGLLISNLKSITQVFTMIPIFKLRNKQRSTVENYEGDNCLMSDVMPAQGRPIEASYTCVKIMLN